MGGKNESDALEYTLTRNMWIVLSAFIVYVENENKPREIYVLVEGI